MKRAPLKIEGRGQRSLHIERELEAPRWLVYEAYTKPDLLKRWLGVFGGWTLDTCEMDVRSGGAYRWVWRNRDAGGEMGVGGTFREVEAPDRFVATERFDQPWYPGEAVVTTTFTERDGRTVLALDIEYQSEAARDAVLDSPMKAGIERSYALLDELLAAERARM